MSDHVIEATGERPRTTEPYIVECVPGEMFRYRVASVSNPDSTHLVDLMENDFYGECGCADHVCRRFPAHRKTGSMRRCKHLDAARDTILRYLMKNAVKQPQHV